MNKLRIAGAIISILLIVFLFWYFIGGSLTTRFVNETIPLAVVPSSTNLPPATPNSTNSATIVSTPSNLSKTTPPITNSSTIIPPSTNSSAIIPTPTTTSKASSAEPILLKQGSFTVIDSVHRGSGIAKIIQTGSKYYIVLENFKVTNGPDLYVYLSKNSDIKSENDLGEYKEIAPLKGNEGNQVYEISEEDAKNFSSVVIWCKRFGVLFSSATLSLETLIY